MIQGSFYLGGQNTAQKIEQTLLAAETTLALVDSLSPLNFEAEVERLTKVFRSGEVDLPAFRYDSAEGRGARASRAETLIFSVRRALDAAPPDLDREFVELLWTRAHELLVEVELLRKCDSPAVIELSSLRFRLSDEEVRQAVLLCADWLREKGEPDDEQPRSLSTQLSALCRKSEVAAQIVIVEREIAAIAAIGEQTLYVRKGSMATSHQARRIWAHEVEGHLLPRLAARTEAPPFSVGSPGCSVDEEGRAILIEERSGVLDAARKREIARRFLIARAVSTGGMPAALDVIREFLGDSTEETQEAEIARALCRVARGGGLCREIIYVPGYLRVKDAVTKNPQAEQFFRRGRASVSALPFFARAFG